MGGVAGSIAAGGPPAVIPLAFTPTSEGAQSRTLGFTSNVPGSPDSVALAGTGCVPRARIQVAVPPGPSIAFGAVQRGFRTVRLVRVRTPGTVRSVSVRPCPAAHFSVGNSRAAPSPRRRRAGCWASTRCRRAGRWLSGRRNHLRRHFLRQRRAGHRDGPVDHRQSQRRRRAGFLRLPARGDHRQRVQRRRRRCSTAPAACSTSRAADQDRHRDRRRPSVRATRPPRRRRSHRHGEVQRTPEISRRSRQSLPRIGIR